MKYRICCKHRETGTVEKGPWMVGDLPTLVIEIGKIIFPEYEHSIETKEDAPLPSSTDIAALIKEIQEDGT